MLQRHGTLPPHAFAGVWVGMDTQLARKPMMLALLLAAAGSGTLLLLTLPCPRCLCGLAEAE